MLKTIGRNILLSTPLRPLFGQRRRAWLGGRRLQRGWIRQAGWRKRARGRSDHHPKPNFRSGGGDAVR